MHIGDFFPYSDVPHLRTSWVFDRKEDIQVNAASDECTHLQVDVIRSIHLDFVDSGESWYAQRIVRISKRLGAWSTKFPEVLGDWALTCS